MCILCDPGKPQFHSTSRRNFLKGTAATGLAAGAMTLFGPRAEAQGHNVNPPPHTGEPGRQYVIRNGYVMTMEPGTICSPRGRGASIRTSGSAPTTCLST